MDNHDKNFKGLITIMDRLEALLRTKGLPEGVPSTELEDLINSVEGLLETANELFEKVG